MLLVATASAMRDNPSRGYELVFGTGVHACLGKTLAMAQITEIFEALLSRDEVHVSNDQWGRIFRVGVFPRRLDIAFKPAFGSQTQGMVTVLAPLAAKADLKAWRDEIEHLTAQRTSPSSSPRAGQRAAGHTNAYPFLRRARFSLSDL